MTYIIPSNNKCVCVVFLFSALSPVLFCVFVLDLCVCVVLKQTQNWKGWGDVKAVKGRSDWDRRSWRLGIYPPQAVGFVGR
jgi:hypothetical protein